MSVLRLQRKGTDRYPVDRAGRYSAVLATGSGISLLTYIYT